MGGGPGTSTPAVMCLRCGYDLRTVDAAGVCPECGLAAAASTGVRERLEECPPGWVRLVAVGAGLLAASAVLLAMPAGAGIGSNAPIGGGLLRGVPSARGVAAWSFWAFVRMGGVVLLYGVGMLLQGVGVWLVTGREPGGVRTRAGWTAAWLVLTLVALGGVAIDVYFELGAGAVPWMTVGTVVGRLAYVACPAIGLWHLRWLTVRMGRPKLAEYAGIVGAGLSALLLLFTTAKMLVTFRWAAFYHPYVQFWWVYRNMEEVTVVGPVVGIGVVYAMQRLKGVRAYKAGYAWLAVIWVLATAWAVELETRNYTRRLWETVLAVGVPVAVGVTFYLWALGVLGRTAWTLWKASREAEEAWRRSDAAVGGEGAG